MDCSPAAPSRRVRQLLSTNDANVQDLGTVQRRNEDCWMHWRQNSKIRLHFESTDGSGVAVDAVAADARKSVGRYPSPVKGTSDCADDDGEEVAEEHR